MSIDEKKVADKSVQTIDSTPVVNEVDEDRWSPMAGESPPLASPSLPLEELKFEIKDNEKRTELFRKILLLMQQVRNKNVAPIPFPHFPKPIDLLMECVPYFEGRMSERMPYPTPNTYPDMIIDYGSTPIALAAQRFNKLEPRIYYCYQLADIFIKIYEILKAMLSGTEHPLISDFVEKKFIEKVDQNLVNGLTERADEILDVWLLWAKSINEMEGLDEDTQMSDQ